MLVKHIAVAVAAFLVAGVAADRIAASVAEHRLAARLSCVAGTSDDLDVSVGGFPFLAQLATKSFTDVTVKTDHLTVRRLALTDVRIKAHDVRLPEAGGEASAGSVSVEAVLGYGSLTSLLGSSATALAGATFGTDGDGLLTISTSLAFRGIDMPATVYARLALAGDRLTVAPDEIELSGLGLRVPASRLPAAAAGSRTVDLPALPDGLAYTGIAATRDGLDVTVTGSGLHGRLGTSTNCGGKTV